MKRRIISLFIICAMVFALLPVSGFAAQGDVSTFAELKAALADATTTYIKLQSDIQILKECIAINPVKPSLTIDGNGKTIIQADSSTCEYVLQLKKEGAIRSILIKDLYITGKSKYGFIYVPSDDDFANVTITFDHVNYTGPELVKARYCNIIIEGGNYVVAPGHCDTDGYLVDGRNITLKGVVMIDKQIPASCRVMFRVNKYGTLMIAEHANVCAENNTKVVSKCSKSGFAKFEYCKSAFIVGYNASLKYTGVNSFIYGCDIDFVEIRENANLDVTVLGNIYPSAMLEVDNFMTVKRGAVLKMIAIENENKKPVIRLDYSKGLLLFDNPAFVLLSNNSGKKSCHGLALGNVCSQLIQYNGVYSVEYWVQNDSPVGAAGPAAPATYRFANDINDYNMFSAAVLMHCGDFKCASTSGYFGSLPFNKTTHSLKNTNVLRIYGGTADT